MQYAALTYVSGSGGGCSLERLHLGMCMSGLARQPPRLGGMRSALVGVPVAPAFFAPRYREYNASAPGTSGCAFPPSLPSPFPPRSVGLPFMEWEDFRDYVAVAGDDRISATRQTRVLCHHLSDKADGNMVREKMSSQVKCTKCCRAARSQLTTLTSFPFTHRGVNKNMAEQNEKKTHGVEITHGVPRGWYEARGPWGLPGSVGGTSWGSPGIPWG